MRVDKIMDMWDICVACNPDQTQQPLLVQTRDSKPHFGPGAHKRQGQSRDSG